MPYPDETWYVLWYHFGTMFALTRPCPRPAWAVSGDQNVSSSSNFSTWKWVPINELYKGLAFGYWTGVAINLVQKSFILFFFMLARSPFSNSSDEDLDTDVPGTPQEECSNVILKSDEVIAH